MPMSEPIMGWCIQCGKEHGGFYCPQDPNPPKNAAYWKRRAKALESQVKEMQNDMAMIARLLEKEGFEGGSIIDHIVGTIYCHLKP